MRGLAYVLPVCSASNISDGALRHAMLLGKAIQRALWNGASRALCNPVRVSYIAYLRLSKHSCVMLLALSFGAVHFLVGPLFGVSAPSKIDRAGVGPVPVEMAALVPWTRSIPMERGANQLVDGLRSLSGWIGLTKADFKVAVGTDRRRFDAADLGCLSRRSSASDAAQITYLVWPSNYGAPFFGYVCGGHFESPMSAAFIAYRHQFMQAE